MRTTLAIDDDILAIARGIARRDRKPIGEVVSDLARTGMKSRFDAVASRNSFAVLPKRGAVITPEIVNALREEE